MAALFISDWGPTPALEESEYTRALGRLGRTLKPSGIVIVSGHWQSQRQLLSGRSEIIYDYYGFPEAAYRIKYPMPPNAQLGRAVIETLSEAGIGAETADRGIDHGAWVPLSRLFPTMAVPVVQLSLPADPKQAYALGKALEPLQKRGVLIVASGALIHNLGLALRSPQDAPPEQWAATFRDWVIDRIIEDKTEELFSYRRLAPGALKAAPTPEHFTPLLFALGARSGKPEILHESMTHGSGLLLLLRL